MILLNLDYKNLLDKQRKYFLTGKTKDVEFRIKRLKALKEIIIKRNQEIVEALRKDFGKSEFETFSNEIMTSLEEIKLAIKKLHSWAAPRKVKTPIAYFKSSSRIYYEPYGIALIISAWNYPFQLAINPLIGAISAGNCCIIKPSELAPNTSKLLSEIIKECFDEEYCAIVEGGAQETTALLNEKFDFILYTGSTHVGKIVAQAAAKHLTPVVLEMGGKSPCIIDNTADIEISARRIVWGKFLNAGQTCVAPDYLLVHKEVKDSLMKAIQKYIKDFYGDNPENSKDYCRIINEKHFDRLCALLEEGDIVAGGQTNRSQLYIEPTVIDHVTWNYPIMQEEIFGPILPIIEYEDLTNVIEMINAHEKPLALYIFSKNKKVQKKIINETSFGGGCINTTVLHAGNPYLPFGGVGSSGMGNYHGKASFDTFSHQKGILNKSLIVDPKFIYPPYKNKVDILKKMYR